MLRFEEKYIYLLIKNKSVISLRYKDDIFMVWIKSESELRQFMNKINEKLQSIKFYFKFSKESTAFLDTLVYIQSNNRRQTTFYEKLNDYQNYLHALSLSMCVYVCVYTLTPWRFLPTARRLRQT